ncbi:hypothetical protein QAD02_011050 [Eretmocerus hayati]|uniref:Uncharacterized protein n=1 Tax=Eretmocerus hayati TaxID=131215 RepID=A0ACC2NVG8_9HYME|nr:hypothetical protein QAD02_011050 [Eretmocerus hayati]
MSAPASNGGKLVPVKQSWEWMINNSCIKNDHKNLKHVIESPIFKAQTVDGAEVKWLLRFYPKGNYEGKYDYASVQLVSLNNFRVLVKYQLSIVQNLKSVREYDSGHTPEIFHCSGWERGDRFLKRSIIMDDTHVNLKDDNLSIFCYLDSPVCSPIRKRDEKQMDSICDDEFFSIQNDILLELVTDQEFGDIDIEVKGKQFRAHRVLLSNHSGVLSKIISKTENEKRGLVSIDDLDDKVFLEILRFIYFNKMNGIEKSASEFFAAAKKYDMEKMKKMCVVTMSKNLSSENAIEYLGLADLFELEDFKKQILEFMALNLTKIVKSSSFRTMKEMNKSVLFELIQTMASKMS